MSVRTHLTLGYLTTLALSTAGLLSCGGKDIPRGEITLYAFVLAPLAEIAPDLRHPESGRAYAELAAELGEQAKTLWKVPFDFG